MNYGYVRVSTDRQDTGSDAQRRALEAAGVDEIVEEQASGRKARPILRQLLDRLQPGDTLTVFRFDRLSRTVIDFHAIGEQISAKGASLRSLRESYDTGSPFGRAMMIIVSALAQLEAETTTERVKNGLAGARARGVQLGRRRELSTEVEQDISHALADGAAVAGLARKYDVSRTTIQRIRKRVPASKLATEILTRSDDATPNAAES